MILPVPFEPLSSAGGSLSFGAPRVTGRRISFGVWPARVDLLDPHHGAPLPFGRFAPDRPAAGATRLVPIADFAGAAPVATAQPARLVLDDPPALENLRPQRLGTIATLVGLACPYDQRSQYTKHGDGTWGYRIYERGCFREMVRLVEWDKNDDVPVVFDAHWPDGGVLTTLGDDCRVWEANEGLMIRIPLYDRPLDRKVLNRVRYMRTGVSIAQWTDTGNFTLRDGVKRMQRVDALVDVTITDRPNFPQTWLKIETENGQ